MHHHSGREEDTPVSVPGPILGWPRRLPVPPISSDASTATTTICSNPPAVTIQSINRTQRKHAYAQHSSLLLDKCLCRWPRRCPLTRGLTTAHGRGVRVTITRAADSRRYGPRASQDSGQATGQAVGWLRLTRLCAQCSYPGPAIEQGAAISDKILETS